MVVRAVVRDIVRPVVRDVVGGLGATDLRADVIAALFGAGEQGVFLGASETGNLAQNSDGSGAVTAGDPVGLVSDLSGNGNNATQATAAHRMVYRTTDGGSIESDRTDDELEISGAIGGAGVYTVFWSYPESYTTENALLFAYQTTAGSNVYAGLGQDGSTSTLVAITATINSFRTDGSDASFSTRGDLHSALVASNYCVMEINTSNSNGNCFIGRTPVGPFYCPKRWTVFGLVKKAVTGSDLALLEQYLASRS